MDSWRIETRLGRHQKKDRPATETSDDLWLGDRSGAMPNEDRPRILSGWTTSIEKEGDVLPVGPDRRTPGMQRLGSVLEGFVLHTHSSEQKVVDE